MITDKSEQALDNELRAAGFEIRGKAIRCGFHEDRHPSASKYVGQDGITRVKCHACGFSGDAIDVQAKRTGRSRQEIFREAAQADYKTCQTERAPTIHKTIEELRLAVSRSGQIVAEYQDGYRNPDSGQVEMIEFRLEPKTFRMGHPVKGGFSLTAPPKPWAIYNRKAIRESETIVIVEGPGKCDLLAEYGFVATTSPGGAKNAASADWSALAGKKIIFWRDADEPGQKYETDVTGILQQQEPAPRIFRVEPGNLDLKNGEDVKDYVTQLKVLGADVRQELEKVFANAVEVSVLDGLRTVIEDTISGKRQAIQLPWRNLFELTFALLPGMLTIIAGAPGALKSFCLLQLLAFLYEGGIKIALFELEHNKEYHLNRLLAQRSGCSDLLDPGWVRENPDRVKALFAEHKTFLEGFALSMSDAEDLEITLDDLANWVRQKAEAGCRVIALDPVTIVERNAEPWLADQRFLLRCKASVRKYGASLILVTHPRKGSHGMVGLDDLAGGAAYQRFSQAIIWLEKFAEPKEFLMKGDCGRFVSEVNMCLHICKASNARGHGMRLGFNFDGATLRFAEQGIIYSQGKGTVNG